MVDLFFYRPPEEINAEKKAQEALLQQQQQQQQQAHVAPFEQGNAQFRPHTEGANEWVNPNQNNANVPQENPWDLAQGESFRAGNNNPQPVVQQPAGGSNWDS